MPKKGKTEGVTAKIDELKAKINWFYSDDFKLDAALECYDEVIKLSKEIEKELEEIKNSVTVLSKDFSK
ncbi:MAG: hypothetical protein LBH36_02095 [Candidatus Nomurabacteria bacterium]|jgi:exonuclease VII small subunit|nr:hypothetical protein [Candidatus Nomurabacteria bacterium]